MPISALTARDLFTEALLVAGVTGPGDGAPSAEDVFSCLQISNGMLDSWQIDHLFVYSEKLVSDLPLTSGTQEYTIGESGIADFNIPRPARISWARVTLTGTPDVQYPLLIIGVNEWLQISIPRVGPVIPTKLYYQPDYPDGVIRLYGYPPGGYLLDLQYWMQLTQFETLDDTFTFPPGYWDAILYSLAERMAQRWGNTKELPEISRMARESRGRIQSLNQVPSPFLINDASGLMTRGTGGGQKSQILAPTNWYR